MFYSELPAPAGSREFTELKRDDILRAIEAARVEGYAATEDALRELLDIVHEIQADGGQIRYRFKPKPYLL